MSRTMQQRMLTLKIGVKKITRLYTTYVRSILIYGLVLYDEAEEIHKLDVKLMQILVKKLLWAGRAISHKHMMRLYVAMRIPTLETMTERMAHQWIQKLKETSLSTEDTKIKIHALKTLEAISTLKTEHKLNKALRRDAINWDVK